MKDLILTGGRVHGHAAADTVLLRGGKIEAIGSRDEVRVAAPAAEEIDVRSSLVLPGFIDTHTHFFELARRRAGIDLEGLASLDAVVEALRAARASVHPEQKWIGGGGWDPAKYDADPRMNRQVLDEVFPDQAVVLESRDFHTLWCNTRALERAGVMAGAAAPPGGRVGVDADGRPDGFLYETAWDLVWGVRPPEPDPVASAWIQETTRFAHALGLTSIHCMEPTSTYQQYRRMAERDELRLRITFHTPRADLNERIETSPGSYRPEHPWLRRGGVKIFGDGSLGSRSAWMSTAYPDGTYGAPLLSAEELTHDVMRAARAGIAPTVHAIGDRTLEMVLDAFRTLREDPGHASLLLRIEHAQCVPPSAVADLAELGVFCAVQPVHLADDVALLPSEWGAMAEHAYPLRRLADAGVALGLGSDAPVATLDPLAGIAAAVTRADASGTAWTPEQALRVDEAVAGYTKGAARGGAWPHDTGVLQPGALADVVVRDDVRDGDWSEAAARLTVVGGEVVYDALG